MSQAKPFVKWVGGKRAIINELVSRLPNKINNYYEPFCGGGALFYEINNSVNYSYLSDLNVELVVSYNVIKNNPDKLLELLQIHQKNHCSEYFYKIREMQELTDSTENTARFIYLLKTCFNGLYRVNKSGNFNAPCGKYKNPKIADFENIKAVSDVLQNVEIKYQSFEKIAPQKGDFVYFDPPYHETFTGYVANGFNDEMQIKLRDFAFELSNKGVNVMLSNSDTVFINDLYKNHFKIEKIPVPRMINCKGDGRGAVLETLITNYL